MSTTTTTEPNNNKPSLFSPNISEIQKVFNRFDTNGDGKISADELIHVMKSLGSDTSDDQVKQMMKNIDTDSDGFINLEEFTGFCRANDETQNEDESLKELREAFDMYDLNNNGLISASELLQILTRLGEKCTVDDCVKMITSVDSDGDGCVDFDEFKKMMMSSSGGSNGEGSS